MPLMPIGNLDDVPEEQLAPEGSYDLTVVNVTDTDDAGDQLMTAAGDRAMVRVAIRIEDEEEYSLLNHWLVFPKEDDEQSTKVLMLRNVKRFLYAFGVEWNPDGFDSEDLNGATAEDVFVKRKMLSLKNKETGQVEEREVNQLSLARIPTE